MNISINRVISRVCLIFSLLSLILGVIFSIDIFGLVFFSTLYCIYFCLSIIFETFAKRLDFNDVNKYLKSIHVER
jgi:hypothetical protein